MLKRAHPPILHLHLQEHQREAFHCPLVHCPLLQAVQQHFCRAPRSWEPFSERRPPLRSGCQLVNLHDRLMVGAKLERQIDSLSHGLVAVEGVEEGRFLTAWEEGVEGHFRMALVVGVERWSEEEEAAGVR